MPEPLAALFSEVAAFQRLALIVHTWTASYRECNYQFTVCDVDSAKKNIAQHSAYRNNVYIIVQFP